MPKFIELHSASGELAVMLRADRIVAVTDRAIRTDVWLAGDEQPYKVAETVVEVMEKIKEASDAEG